MTVIADIFGRDPAFSATTLTDAINEVAYKPGRLGELGLFEAEPVDTTTIAVAKKGEILVLVPSTPRGAPGVTIDKEKANQRNFSIPHFEINDKITAEEIQNVIAFGTDRARETMANKIALRQRTMVNSFGVTEEYARMGAVKGIVVYPTGSADADLNLFTEFGVTQATEIDFDLDNNSPVGGVLRKKCAGVVRQLQDALGGIPFSGAHAFCGDAFFDDLLAHPEVRETFKGWSEAQILREGYIAPNRGTYPIFEFGGIVWENYRGSVGSTGFIGTDKCQILPLGVPGLFKSFYGPSDLNPEIDGGVNQMGQRLIMPTPRPSEDNKGYKLDGQMNALQLCLRPQVLIPGKRT
ncbi:major capsid protein [Ancylobacter sp. WKF20]|uniref:major capsid protein n=1 Tax=Ancylobacter sp. WKF20 TaxID=3039801 RepID=UPI0024342792|nr:major capsid protein [Ancylobacter sp. WKF20]WGD31214.1 major capsid protein [Ancylobacter sp. WKF20]